MQDNVLLKGNLPTIKIFCIFSTTNSAWQCDCLTVWNIISQFVLLIEKLWKGSYYWLISYSVITSNTSKTIVLSEFQMLPLWFHGVIIRYSNCMVCSKFIGFVNANFNVEVHHLSAKILHMFHTIFCLSTCSNFILKFKC